MECDLEASLEERPVHVGRSVERVEDGRLLTGRGSFVDDRSPLPGELAAAMVRSPAAHGRLVAVRTDAALAVPGVVAVVGPGEVAAGLAPFALSVPVAMEYRPAAVDRVRYAGEPIAVVVATDRAIAEDAAELVEVYLEPWPAVVSVEEALAEGAALLHPRAGTNVATDRTFNFGEVDEAFRLAARVVEGSFEFPRYSSTPIECYVVVASYDSSGEEDEATLWCNFHGPFVLHPLVAAALGIAPSRLRLLVPPDVGGSFGIKAGIYPYLALLALASKHAGAPVRWTEDRLEHLVASSYGAGRTMKFSAAVSSDGQVTALDVDLIDDVGAYLRPPEPSTLYRCFGNLTGAYGIRSLRARARAVVTNKAPTGLNRGFGGQQLYFGLERLMDRIAVDLGVDPAELRRKNFVPPGAFPYRTPSGGCYDSGDYPGALDLLLRRADYPRLRAEQEAARAQGRLVGIGMATIVDPSGTNLGYVSVATPAESRASGHHKSGSTELVALSIDPAGQVTVRLGSTPQGQGHETVARQVVADQLGLEPSQVRVTAAMDTATTPWTVTSGSYSSRFAPLTTSALVEAAERLAETLKAAASVRLGIPAGRLEMASGMIRVVGEPERSCPIRQAAGLVHWDPGSLPAGVEPRLSVEVAFSPPGSLHPGSDDTVNSSICYGFVADLVVVEVDPDTLEIRVSRIVSVHDPGTVLNPALLDGQTLGSIAHALGGALLEEFAWSEEGQPLVTTFMDYLCPTAAEMAFDLELDHLVTPSPFTRLGAKGSGEGSSMSIPAALANAVEDALRPLGVTCDRLPLTPSALHRALVRQEPPRWR